MNKNQRTDWERSLGERVYKNGFVHLRMHRMQIQIKVYEVC